MRVILRHYHPEAVLGVRVNPHNQTNQTFFIVAKKLKVVQSAASKSGKSYWAMVATVMTKKIGNKDVSFASAERFWLSPSEILPIGTEIDEADFADFLVPVVDRE